MEEPLVEILQVSSLSVVCSAMLECILHFVLSGPVSDLKSLTENLSGPMFQPLDFSLWKCEQFSPYMTETVTRT